MDEHLFDDEFEDDIDFSNLEDVELPSSELSDDFLDENDHIKPHKFDKSILGGKTLKWHIENVIKSDDFQDSLDSLFDVMGKCDETIIDLDESGIKGSKFDKLKTKKVLDEEVEKFQAKVKAENPNIEFEELPETASEEVERTLDYASSMIFSFISDEFRQMAKIYCYEHGYSQELADEMDMEFSRINANFETDGWDDFDIAMYWERD